MKIEYANLYRAEQGVLRTSVKKCAVQFSQPSRLTKNKQYAERCMLITCDKKALEVAKMFAANVMVDAEKKGLEGFDTFIFPTEADGKLILDTIKVDHAKAHQTVNTMNELLSHKLAY